MTTITIHLPIAPGATTCEGCPCHRYSYFDFCGAFRDANGDGKILKHSDGSSKPLRLPECLAAERVIVREHWDVITSSGYHQRFLWEPSERGESWDTLARKQARKAAHRYARKHNGKIVHVTRWRSK